MKGDKKEGSKRKTKASREYKRRNGKNKGGGTELYFAP